MKTILVIIITTAFSILQSVLLVDIMPMGVVPDLALILLIAASWSYGSIIGSLSGFFSGLTFDIIGIAPLGFHAFLLTWTGYLFGLLNSKIEQNHFFLPILMTFAATTLKYSGAYVLSLVFEFNSSPMRYFRWETLMEACANIILAPIVFWFFSLVVRITERHRGGFQ